ncbi:MAG: ATP-binding cassette domain-containing protein [Chloroflexaceae bacterium]|jgi:energy-coupling factor transport system ATP-binding protein|nr:ATP-binding cassette domain-containing protein [Chloroflexaceae bacterium]
MIELTNVSYTYPGTERPTLRDLSLTVCEGEFLLVCGPSGAGKSTFLRLLNGLVPHFYGGRFGGSVRVWNRDTLQHQPRAMADLVGFVFQDPEAQFVVDTVEDELVFGMENLGLPQPLMRRRVEEVLDQLGIAHLRRRRISALSGGEKQRVAIAAVLAAQPRALVLDEPTSQLDPHGAEEVLTALQKLNADLGLTVVLCEHRLERVVQYADRVLFFGLEGSENSPGYAIGPTREMLQRMPLVPPLQALGRALGWQPLPLTIKEGRVQARSVTGDGSSQLAASSLQFAASSQQFAVPETRQSSKALRAALSGNVNRQSSIQISSLTFRYGDHEALYKLSLSFEPGQVTALMGRNGSGKTTLLKLLIGLLRPNEGRVELLGRDIVRVPTEELAQHVGYVPQDPRSFLFHDTLWEELAFTLKNREPNTNPWISGLPSPVSRLPSPVSGQIEATLEQLGLAHLAGRYPRDLSGGEAQRAALAAVLVGRPQLLLLDEPTRGLDYAAKAELSALLRTQAATGRTVVMATHDVELVAACADRVALLGDGELVAEGPTAEIMGDSLIFSSQVAKLFPRSGWLTVKDVLGPKRER